MARSASSICPGPPVFLFVEEAGRDRILGKRLQSERRNEFSRILRHDDENVVSLLDQQAGQLRGFVGGDGAGDAEHNAFRLVLRCAVFVFGGNYREFVWA